MPRNQGDHEGRIMTDKCELGCLKCGTRFSVNNGDEEVNWNCPVCALRSLVREMGEFVKDVKGYPLPSIGGDYIWSLHRQAEALLSNPEVKAIMEEEGSDGELLQSTQLV